MTTFRQALLVSIDEPVKSRHLSSLAAAVNDRLASGVGDFARRVVFYWFGGLLRQIRNPDSSFNLYPAQAEFFQFYQQLDPYDAQWPVSGPGDPEGTNIACPLVAYLQGAEAIDLVSERIRLSLVSTGFTDGQPLTPWRQWLLGESQRGGFDPTTGEVGCPVFSLARAYSIVRQSITSPHGNAAGGYLPGPEIVGDCETEGAVDQDVYFTNLVTGEVRHYGTCPEDAGAIAGIGYGPAFYFVVLNSGASFLLARSQWIEGPYTGNPRLQKTQSGALGRVLNAFASEFRGTESQRAEGWMENAFALQEFCTRQYALAPQAGVQIGAGAVLPVYPQWEFAQAYDAPGSAVDLVNGPGVVGSGLVCHGWAATVDGLQRRCRVQLRVNGQLAGELLLAPENGHAEAIQIFATSPGLGVLQVDLPDGIDLDPGGRLTVKASTLLDYQPQLHDWAAVTRLASYNAAIDRPDGIGIEVSAARAISDGLLNSGCVIPIVEASPFAPAGIDPAINQNAVFDTARRFSQHVRIMPRWNLVAYEVTGGKSVLYMDRWAMGMSNDTPIDLLKNIGPKPRRIESGEIVWGRRYRVASGRATYQGQDYLMGQEFVGVVSASEYTGGGDVREIDGIRPVAEPQGFSNRWLLDLTLKPYHPSNSSVWKPEAYGDQVTPFLDRCHIDGPEIAEDDALLMHISFGQEPPYVPEAMSSLRYARIGPNSFGYTNANRRNCAEDDDDCNAEKAGFYRSCRIFEPPVEIQSAEEVSFGGRTVVKLTLTGRLHHDEDEAPSSVSSDVGDWDLDELRTGEPYRTLENGLREYLVYQAGLGNPSRKVGDWALNSGLASDPDNPLGTILPTFFLVQMIPEPYVDANDDQDEHDSPLYHDQLMQVELYLRAGCEGFVDGVTTAQAGCEHGGVDAYDFTEANLHFAASGNRWVPWQPASARPDNPQGFGPNPNTLLSAEIYNSLARAVNSLTDVRIMLPAELEGRTNQGFATGSIPAVDECGVPQPCGAGSTYWVGGRTGIAAGPQGILSDWTPLDDSGGGSAGYRMVGGATVGEACDGDNWKIEADYSQIEFRWTLTDPESVHALPPGIRGYLETDAVAAMEIANAVEVSSIAYLPAPIDGNPVSSVGLCSSTYAWWVTQTTTWSTCGMVHRTIVPPGVPAGDVAAARTTGGGTTVAGAGGGSSAGATIFQNGTALIRIPTVPYAGL